MKKILIAAVIVAVSMAGTAQAILHGDEVDIRIEMGLPFVPHDLGPRVFEAIGVTVDDSVELDSTDEIENPSDWFGNVGANVDGRSDLITIFVEAAAPYQRIDVWLADLDWGDTAGTITGLSLVADELLNPISDPTTLNFTWGDDSVHIAWTIDEPGEDEVFGLARDGFATFQIHTRHHDVPETGATIVLLAFGVVAIVSMHRRIQQ